MKTNLCTLINALNFNNVRYSLTHAQGSFIIDVELHDEKIRINEEGEMSLNDKKMTMSDFDVICQLCWS